MLAADRLEALRQAIHACGKGGTVSMPGVYGGLPGTVPTGASAQDRRLHQGGAETLNPENL